MADKEPRGELARYAYGYSDQKPSITWWLILIGMLGYILYYSVELIHETPDPQQRALSMERHGGSDPPRRDTAH